MKDSVDKVIDSLIEGSGSSKYWTVIVVDREKASDSKIFKGIPGKEARDALVNAFTVNAYTGWDDPEWLDNLLNDPDSATKETDTELMFDTEEYSYIVFK